MKLYQQGDILLKTGTIPPKAVRAKELILAYGEKTGHCHRVEGEGAAVMELGGVRYLDAPNGAIIVHDEHQSIEVPAGVFEIGIVREYDHFLEESRSVRD